MKAVVLLAVVAVVGIVESAPSVDLRLLKLKQRIAEMHGGPKKGGNGGNENQNPEHQGELEGEPELPYPLTGDEENEGPEHPEEIEEEHKLPAALMELMILEGKCKTYSIFTAMTGSPGEGVLATACPLLNEHRHIFEGQSPEELEVAVQSLKEYLPVFQCVNLYSEFENLAYLGGNNSAEIVEFEQQAGELLGECMDIFTSVQAELQLIKEGMDDAEEQAMEVKKKRMLNSLYGLMSSLKDRRK